MEGRRHLTFDIFANSSDPAAKIIPTRESQPVVHSPEAIAEVQRWIRSFADHKHCSTTTDVLLPTRVIEVLPTFSKQRSRLLVTNGLKGRYNTLSYCWGTQNTVLTRKNLAQFQREIDLSILSNTVQDAIEVTVSLGIPYLWVDAICILQDCPRDKALEISRMASIYQSSHITIVAASAKNADEGFLLPRKASSPANTIPFMHHGFRAGTVNIRRRREVSSEETPRPPLDPVDKRAWTFQEQLLSQRLLVYSTDTLQWRCKGVVANLGSSKYEAQCDVRLPPSARAIDYVGSEPKPLFFPPPLFLPPGSTSSSYQQLLKQSRIKKLHTHWSHLIEEYSLRSMTYASDKLLALAGIAEKFGDALGTKYLAGFWEDNILEYLIWHPEKSAAKTSLYRAPSWSWASLDGKFAFDSDLATRPDQDPNRQYQQYYRAYDCRILRCQITLKDDLLPYGEVTGGHIELSAVLRRAWYGDPYVGLHWLENASDFGMLSGVDPRPSCAGTSWYSGEVFCVALWIRRRIWENVHTVKGLMLMHKENVIYERIGWFESSTENFDGRPIQTITIV